MHTAPIAPTLLALAIILVAGRVGGHLATLVRQPQVLGELLVGIVLGNLGLPFLDALKSNVTLEALSELGVILLLFQIGLESTINQMLRVGWSALLVATLGVLGPFALGWMVGVLLLPAESVFVHAFIGAMLSATSVGITARVLKDLGRQDCDEARIILGAAVIDDVMGLVILAVVTGAIAAADRGTSVSYGSVAAIVAKASLSLVVALALGSWLSPRLFAFASKLHARGVLLATGLSFCFVLAWAADLIGLAPIVGAFAAGLILDQLHYRDFTDRGEHTLEHLIDPLVGMLAPVFFILMGLRMDLRMFSNGSVIGLALALTVAAIVGKQLSSLGVVGQRVNRLAVGVGMIPRGEVGLIFANIGLTLTIGGAPVVSPGVYAAAVIMVLVTTLVTPPMLAWSFRRPSAARQARHSVQND